MPRAEAELLIKSLGERIDKIENFERQKSGEGIGLKSGFAWVLTIIAVIAAAMGWFR